MAVSSQNDLEKEGLWVSITSWRVQRFIASQSSQWGIVFLWRGGLRRTSENENLSTSRSKISCRMVVRRLKFNDSYSKEENLDIVLSLRSNYSNSEWTIRSEWFSLYQWLQSGRYHSFR
ncbi:hypothetical protein CEXT_67381 [Caerostris extrusa]|uniref:Uncharacterized protein n=1 Tax=Caerostris extrusa TaxID=172846 RepID=A0AAV4XUH2_CAEEX|nr:hypothetical protein CEXT_67381 [Caerostris extrusa]